MVAGAVIGWWYRETDTKHFDYWLGHAIPHVLILHDLETGSSHWARIEPAAVQFTEKGAKIFVPSSGEIGESDVDKLLDSAWHSQELWAMGRHRMDGWHRDTRACAPPIRPDRSKVGCSAPKRPSRVGHGRPSDRDAGPGAVY